jgi:hypothetical protein
MESSVEQKMKDDRVWESNPSIIIEERPDDVINRQVVDAVVNADLVVDEREMNKIVDNEEDQRNSRIFCNRVIVCFMALGLLWMTSLQIAIGIIDVFIKSPSMDAVINACKQSYDVVAVSKKQSGDCVDRQLARCNLNLKKVFLAEKGAKKNYESSNAALLVSLRRRYIVSKVASLVNDDTYCHQFVHSIIVSFFMQW